MKKLHVYLLICILLLAALLRAALIVQRAGAPLEGDELSYDNIAWNLATGHGYKLGDTDEHRTPTAKRGPSYVLFLALIYRIAGHRVGAVHAAQALLDVLCCLFAFNICRLLFGRIDVALTAAALYAVHLAFALSVPFVLTETFTNFAVMLAILAFLEFLRGGRLSALCVSGLAVGIGTLAKPVIAPLPILFFLAVYRGMPRVKWLKGLGIQLALVAVVMSPWIVRNAIAFHAFVPTVTQGGVTFWRGTPLAVRGFGSRSDADSLPEYVVRATRGMSELERDKWFYRDGIRVIRSNPKAHAVLLLKKIPRLWFNLMYETPPSRASMLLALGNLAFIILAVVGILVGKPPRSSVILLALLVLYFTGIHMLFVPVARLSFPVYAYMLCFSAAGLAAIVRRALLSRRTGSAS